LFRQRPKLDDASQFGDGGPRPSAVCHHVTIGAQQSEIRESGTHLPRFVQWDNVMHLDVPFTKSPITAGEVESASLTGETFIGFHRRLDTAEAQRSAPFVNAMTTVEKTTLLYFLLELLNACCQDPAAEIVFTNRTQSLRSRRCNCGVPPKELEHLKVQSSAPCRHPCVGRKPSQDVGRLSLDAGWTSELHRSAGLWVEG
jgi:hypothetical protein